MIMACGYLYRSLLLWLHISEPPIFQGFITMLAGTPLKIFQIIGGLMPALGIAITLQYIFKGESRVFLFIGFVVAVYSGLALLPLGVLSLLCALVYVQVRYREGSGKGNIAEESELEEDF